jgi:PAS domain-containing protein
MWDQFFSTRYHFFLTLFGLTFFPVLVVTIQAAITLPNTLSWPLLSTGLFLTFLTALLSFFITFQFEKKEEKEEVLKVKKMELVQKKEAPKEFEIECVRLEEEALEEKQLRIQIMEELNTSKQFYEEELRQKQVLIEEYQKTLNDQRAIIEKKQKLLEQNESKVHDLTYEIKTLLQLAETGSAIRFHEEPKAKELPKPIKGSDTASNQLKRCLDLAIKLNGVQQFTKDASRFKDLNVDSFALDQRRLFDSLQSEHGSPVLLFSQKERKLTFANDEVRQMLGWSPEKFVQHFKDLVQEGFEEWEAKSLSLKAGEQQDVPLVMRMKSGDESLIYSKLCSIPSGTFKGHVINILYKT